MPTETFVQKPGRKELSTGQIPPGRGILLEDNCERGRRDIFDVRCDPTDHYTYVDKKHNGNPDKTAPLKVLKNGESCSFQIETDQSGPVIIRVVHLDNHQ